MKKNNVEIEKSENLIHEILLICCTKRIDFGLEQSGDKIEADFYEKDPKYLHFKIPNFEDENVSVFLSEWLEKIKAIP